MGIDRIGKGGGVPPGAGGVGGPGGPSGAAPTGKTGKTFEVESPAAAEKASKAEAAGAVAASPLEQLRAGKIDVNQYVDLKLDEATSHLRGLGDAQLAEIRAMLRDKIVQDPQLVDLVRQAAGSVPTPRDE